MKESVGLFQADVHAMHVIHYITLAVCNTEWGRGETEIAAMAVSR